MRRLIAPPVGSLPICSSLGLSVDGGLKKPGASASYRMACCGGSRPSTIYRPSIGELAAVRAAALASELPAILLMEGAGLRRGEVLRVRWADIDLIRGRVRVFRKGASWQPLPLAPDVLDGLRASLPSAAAGAR
jgi:integrase